MTVLTVYPSVDGHVGRTQSGGETWATIRAGAGDGLNQAGTSFDVAWWDHANTNKFITLRRAILIFDTSSLPDTAIITSVKLYLYCNDKVDPNSNNPWIAVYNVITGSDTTLLVSDYQGCGTNLYSTTAITIANMVLGAYNYFVFGSAGKTAINKTGYTKVCLRLEDDVQATAPIWGGGATGFSFYSVDKGTVYRPYLEITYTNVVNHDINVSLAKGHIVGASADTLGKYSIDASVIRGHAVSATRALAIARTAATPLGFSVGDVQVESDTATYLCVASHSGGSIKTKSPIGATWTTCAVLTSVALPGAYFAQYLNRLCVIAPANAGFSYSAVNDIKTDWTQKANFPNLPQSINGLYVGRDASDDPALSFLTPRGVYYLDVFTNFVFGPTEVQWADDRDSGKKGIYWKGDHFIAVNKGIYKITSGEVTLAGPDMDDGLPEDMQGVISDMIGVGFWLVIAIDGSGSGNYSSILKRYISGKHWNVVYKGSTTEAIKALYWDSGTLYFGEGTNVKSLPLSAETDNVAKLSTHTYCASGDLLYPWFHSDFEAMTKVAHKVRAVTRDCNDNDYITIYYRVDEGTTWIELGILNTSPRPTALQFGANAAGVEFERIQFKASFVRGSTNTNSPKLESLTLEYRVTPPVLWSWTFNVEGISQQDVRAKDITDAIKTAMETRQLMSFYPSGSKEDAEYFVEVSEMPGTEKGTEFGKEGIYQMTVSEVVD